MAAVKSRAASRGFSSFTSVRARAMSESSKGQSREYSNTPTRKPRREREERDVEQDDMIRRTLRSNMK